MAYGFALAATALTLGLRLVFGFQAGDPPYLVLFIIPIAFSACVGGIGPGLFATAVAAAEVSYFLLSPFHSWVTDEVSGTVWFSLISAGVLITLFVTLLRASWVLPINGGTNTGTGTLVRRLEMFAEISGGGVYFISALVLLGWMLNLGALESLVSGWPKISPLTACNFLLAGFSLWCLAGCGGNPVRRRAGLWGAVLVAATGLVRLGDDVFGGNLHLDLLGFHESLAVGEAPARMATATSLNFFLLGGALYFSRDLRRFAAFQTLVLLGGVISWLGCLHFLYGGEPLLPHAQMSFLSAFCFVLLTLGIYSTRIDGGLMALFVSDNAGGLLVRRLLPAAVTIPFFVGWALWKAQQAGWFGAEAHIALFGLSNVILFAALIWRNAVFRQRADLERKRAANALRVSEERIRLIVDTALDAVITMDDRSTITGWNSRAEATFGWTHHEAIGRSMAATIIPERYREAHERGLQRFLATGEGPVLNKRFEISALHHDGHEFLIELAITPIRTGSSVIFSAFARDITERKQVEAKLRESEESFRSMANSMSQLAWIAKPDGFIFWYNDRWYEYTGTTPKEMEGWGWQSLHDPQLLPRAMGQWSAAIAAGEPFDMEFPLRGADGIFRLFLTRARPLKDAEGRVIQWFGTNTDVDELKRAEKALRESQALYHSLVEQMPAGVFRKDAEGRYVFVSPFFCHLRNTTADQFLGKLPRELPAAESRFFDQAIRHHAHIMRTGESIEVQDEYHRPDGSTLYLHVVKSPVFDAAGKIVGSQGVLLDVTANKEAEAEVRRLNAELEQRVEQRTAQLEAANKELEAFSYSVSHDLRAPLRGIHGYVRMLVEDYADRLDENGNRLLGVVGSEAKRMGKLIDDLLAFSRMGRQKMGNAVIDMTGLVRGEFENLTRAAPDCAPRFELHPLPTASGDLNMLKQVFANLLGNAIKYSRNQSEPVIEVGSRSGDGETTFFVKDNGVGFDEKYGHKLFGVFQRLHSEEDFEGTGVGLALVQRVVHRHGGKVWAESKLNAGATFFFTIPTQPQI